jgi:hypothetical protein
MPKPNPFFHLISSVRFITGLILALLVGVASGCSTHKTVGVPKALSPLSDASMPQLIDEVNRVAAVRSIHGKVDIQFEDTSFATSGVAEKYRTADGQITLQRPGKVYLVVQVPLIAADVAQMTSDGEHFRVAILKGDEKYQRFVMGTNNAIYGKLDSDGSNAANTSADKEAQTVSALSNLRPQHLTDAMLIRPIDSKSNSDLIYAQTQFFQEENDPSPGSKKRVVRGYYLLDEIQPSGAGAARLLRRFWFDRVNGIRLARMQTFDDCGALITDVSYSDMRKFGEDQSAQLPVRIDLTRPQDRYRITLTYQAPETVKINQDYPPDAFVLTNRWQLKEVDLDATKKNSTTIISRCSR